MSTLVLGAVTAVSGCSGSSDSGTPAPAPATSGTSAPTTGPTTEPTAQAPDPVSAAQEFLSGYVDPDGRVVRRDQGGDTVSEGQAYGLLLAVQAGDQAAAQRIWNWTKTNLQRPDGLLSWQWSGGSVVDANSAADADLYTAQALVLAGRQFGDDTMTQAGTQLARAVLDHETQPIASGRVLLAGSWTTSTPWQVNPSYDAPLAVDTLEQALPDPRWAELRTGNAAVLTKLLASSPLPPDWAQVHDDGTVEAMPPPGGGAVAFGLDAARVVVQEASSCEPADRSAIAALAPVLARDPDAVRGIYDLGGSATVEWSHPLALVAAAGAADAAGDPTRTRQLLAAAARLQESTPTYYGAAWTALGAAMLTPTTENPLGACPTGGSS